MNNEKESGMTVICLEGNGSRPSHRGGGYSVGEVMFTLNQTEVHAVAYRVFDARGNGGGSIAPTITGDHQNRITDYTAVVVKAYEDINGKTVL